MTAHASDLAIRSTPAAREGLLRREPAYVRRCAPLRGPGPDPVRAAMLRRKLDATRQVLVCSTFMAFGAASTGFAEAMFIGLGDLLGRR